MTIPLTFTVALLEGFAQIIADAGIGMAFRHSGQYASADGIPIFILGIPQSPDEIVTLSPYAYSASGSLSDSEVGLQVRTRSGSDPRRVLVMDDAIQNILLGNYPLKLPTGVVVSTLSYLNGAPLGQDDNNRWEWASSYRLDVYRPGPHRH